MSESLIQRLIRTPATRLRQGDQGIGIIDLGDGEPFPIPVTVMSANPTGAIVMDPYGNRFKTQSLLAVGEPIQKILEAEQQAEETLAQQQRQARYQNPQR